MAHPEYNNLNRAQLSYEYLHTNSTTHEFLFGALAELVDNARDAQAKRLDIYSVNDTDLRGGYMLCFLDNGEGMDSQDAANIITFGKSSKRTGDAKYIGQYGNGLKSGSMRVGNDFILFTKRNNQMTMVFLSRTFHEEESIEEVIVPMPSFDENKKSIARGKYDIDKHQMEMSIILKYSPFHNEEELLKQFDLIKGTHGTLVCIYNVKLLDNGDPELDVTSDSHDIILTKPDVTDMDPDEDLAPERKSFRAYTSILYLDPVMQVYINNKKVRTKRLFDTLYRLKSYKYSSARFKKRSEDDVRKAEEEKRAANAKASEAESKARDLEKRIGQSIKKEDKVKVRTMQQAANDLRKEATYKEANWKRKQAELKNPKELNFVFGINLEERAHCGAFVYNSSRLIKMFEKVGPQQEGGLKGLGIVALVDVPFLVLQPTHNKQDFADSKEYRHLLKVLGSYMDHYWEEAQKNELKNVKEFWEKYGYSSHKSILAPPSTELKAMRQRAMVVKTTIQCDDCLKWRALDFSLQSVGKPLPEKWTCSMNNDIKHKTCTAAEQVITISEAVYKKPDPSASMKREDSLKSPPGRNSTKPADVLEKKLNNATPPSSRGAAIARQQSFTTPPSKSETTPQRSSVAKRPAATPSPTPPRRASAQSRRRAKEESEEEEEEEDEEEQEEEESEEEEETPKKRSREQPVKKKTASVPPVKKRAPSPAPKKRAPSPPPKRKEVVVKNSRKAPSPPPKTPPASVGRRSRVKPPVESDSEEEEEEEAPPPQKRKPPPAPSPKENKTSSSLRNQSSVHVPPGTYLGSAKAALKRSSEEEEEEEMLTEPPMTPKPAEKKEEEIEAQAGDVDSTSPDTPNYELGKVVEAWQSHHGKWFRGTVVRTSNAGKIQVKFDGYPSDKYDKWFEITSPHIRLPAAAATPEGGDAKKPAKDKEVKTEVKAQAAAGTGLSPDSTETAAGGDSNVVLEEMSKTFRKLLLYFVPPGFTISPESIQTMSHKELSQFPIDEFIAKYNNKLGMMIEEQLKEGKSEISQKLSQNRRLVGRLLRLVNEDSGVEWNLDVDDDTDEVDRQLEQCIQSSSSSSSHNN